MTTLVRSATASCPVGEQVDGSVEFVGIDVGPPHGDLFEQDRRRIKSGAWPRADHDESAAGASSFIADAVAGGAARALDHDVDGPVGVSLGSSAVMTVAWELGRELCPFGRGLHQQDTFGRFEMSQSARKLADRAAAGHQHRRPARSPASSTARRRSRRARPMRLDERRARVGLPRRWDGNAAINGARAPSACRPNAVSSVA